jgi:hypothetical protein
MKLYRLFTERKNVKNLMMLISESFGGFTIYETTGYWSGKKERSLCIEIAGNETDIPLRMNRLCRQICGYNKQECVLVQIVDVEIQYISTGGIV